MVEKYDQYLKEQYKKDETIRKELHGIAKRVKDGECVALECWCSPLQCHGDVVVRAVEYIVREGRV